MEGKTIHPDSFAALSDFQTAQTQAAGRLRRKVSPQEGAALECLGHAIEYLIDETLFDGNVVNTGVSEAVRLLASASRNVYLGCAEIGRESRTRIGPGTLVLWKWLPSSSSLLPVFRTRDRGQQ